MNWKRILVPHDFSASANHALAVARDEAKAHGSSLTMLHVIELPYQFRPDTVIVSDASGAPVNVRDYAISQAEAHLADLSARLAKDSATATSAVRIGRPVDEIAKFIDENAIDLVIMGTHGRGGLAHMLIGSVTERVVRTSKVPVLTVRHHG
jgi:nucleotide-binding universal stress UspA family protein